MDVRDVSHVSSPLVAQVFWMYTSPERCDGAVRCLSPCPVRIILPSEARSRSSPATILLKVAKARWELEAYP